jgi:hypothetical protein
MRFHVDSDAFAPAHHCLCEWRSLWMHTRREDNPRYVRSPHGPEQDATVCSLRRECRARIDSRGPNHWRIGRHGDDHQDHDCHDPNGYGIGRPHIRD